MSDTAPLILTAGFDEESQRRLNAMRERYFPRARNHIPAHLTLFHHLPGEDRAGIETTLRETAAQTAPMPAEATGLTFLGYGSAYEIAAPGLARLRAALATRWADRLTRQDAQSFRLHVTIQNKVSADRAKADFAEIESDFEPFELTIEGLDLWWYRGGPWEAAGQFAFGT